MTEQEQDFEEWNREAQIALAEMNVRAWQHVISSKQWLIRSAIALAVSATAFLWTLNQTPLKDIAWIAIPIGALWALAMFALARLSIRDWYALQVAKDRLAEAEEALRQAQS